MKNPEQGYQHFLAGIQWCSRIRPLTLAYAAAGLWARRASPRQNEASLVMEHLEKCRNVLAAQPGDVWRAYLEHAGANSLNTYLYGSMNQGWLGRVVKTTGVEHLRDAYARGNGVLVLSAHQHSLMLMGVTIGLLQYPIHAILMDPAVSVPEFLMPYANRAIGDSSSHYNGGGYIFVDYRRSFVRPVYRALQAGRVVVSANDFPASLAPKRRMVIPFLGQQISCPLGSVEIAKQCGATILCAFIRREANGRFVVEFHPIIESERVADVMLQYGAYLEAAVAADPGGWEGWKWAGLFDVEGSE